ncbi:AAA family ATPase [Streptosporangium amethystogenes]|uniref:AAA family ATPase n=1 Tax=Streptosporangium amethystogenes TaxID=2002 RepID=UPI001FE20D73|nr:hypothetical protein [Streptosporangium amethystogenes]
MHPQALEIFVERVREASDRTQFIIATHSPALADRLKPEELIVCERAEDGSSMIPAVSTAQVEKIVRASEGMPLGELWFSGALGAICEQARGTRIRPTRKPIVVVAGEDRNDQLSLRILLEEFCPEMRGRIVEIGDPVRLRQATGANLAARAETLARKVRARAVRDDRDCTVSGRTVSRTWRRTSRGSDARRAAKRARSSGANLTLAPTPSCRSRTVVGRRNARRCSRKRHGPRREQRSRGYTVTLWLFTARASARTPARTAPECRSLAIPPR